MPLDRASVTLHWAFAWLCVTLFIVACSEAKKLSLNVPEGEATSTLLEFARQANVEIVFDAQSIDGVRTREVNGLFDPQSALRIMLRDTPLRLDFDANSGAYAVIRDEETQAFLGVPFPRATTAMGNGLIHVLTKK